MPREIALLGVPSCAGTHGPGQEQAPAAVRAAGLVDGLRGAGLAVRDHGDLPAVPFRTDPDHRDRQNLALVADVARSVADRLGALLAEGALPLVIGGDCTITLGVTAALVARRPDTGLLYFDGDVDLSVPGTTVSGILDTMVLAHLLGEGAPELASIGPRTPLLTADAVTAFGHDPVEVNRAEQDRLARYGLRTHPCTELTGPGNDPVATARAARLDLAARHSQVLLHFDVDVIDSTELPLADFPHFNQGLPLAVALDCLAEFARAPQLAAVVVTEINPLRDPDGSLVRTLTGGLVRALAVEPDTV
ncbi:arginase family protein [Kitasatospora sp. DSM 101779]|uniref:arginase family protein n=1 Tax=Kitasatospora sp. DSM 101779 TaxID=2853165 RepID=UPI0021D8E256|nr:arginase family protein [Kitasatospora sp. DSM 101779]MCU7826370.1 arginase family protein [Kitasatospora sp. DSM 101779]